MTAPRKAVSYRYVGKTWWGECLYVVTFDDGTETEPLPDPSSYGNLSLMPARPATEES